MKKTLNRLRKIKADNCITIILNTHRTTPDSEQDVILLKNLVATATERIAELSDKREAGALTERLHQLAASIDHHYNLESLVLFVNEEVAEYVRLPIAVADRVVIGDTFATRDLVRAMNLESHYYVLVLGKDEARLIEAQNDKLIQEVSSPFPYKNTDYSKVFSAQSKTANRESNLVSEFFNQVDKQVNECRRDNNIPVLICSDEANYYEYMKIADQKDTIMDGFLRRDRQNEQANAIVSDAWIMVKAFTKKKNEARKDELLQAVSENKFLSDISDINRAIEEGRVQTLFLEEGMYQAATLQSGNVVLQQNDAGNAPVIDDIYDDLIENNMDFGGDVVFLPNGELSDFDGFGAITRY